MDYTKKNIEEDFDGLIGLPEGSEWSKSDMAAVRASAKAIAKNRTPERKLLNELLTVRYKMEAYLDQADVRPRDMVTLETFFRDYLKALKISQKKFAEHIDTTDGNLKKYLTGERRFNTDLAMKFGHFFHTDPALWLRIQLKNEMLELQKEKTSSRYKKYDYEKLLQAESK